MIWKSFGKAQFPHSFERIANCPKLCGNFALPQNFHTRKLGEITVFYVISQNYKIHFYLYFENCFVTQKHENPRILYFIYLYCRQIFSKGLNISSCISMQTCLQIDSFSFHEVHYLIKCYLTQLFKRNIFHIHFSYSGLVYLTSK